MRHRIDEILGQAMGYTKKQITEVTNVEVKVKKAKWQQFIVY